VKIVVDLAIACRVPARVVPDAGGFLASFVIAQQMPNLVDEQTRVFLHRVPRHPRVVVVQAPVRVDGHTGD
jgi:hypothetical protein